ncbi:hypothetical protein Glo7428_5252 (plasmid) [Gloeocapsa sp. PCC 7428]|uniref:hypothetical protein n=1 Tax=Gloeocapsa sp. PCC 7428 TaxID=1173026 RepID=UPI0002A5F147|nr:hypothetical protein [Gloeocapsa sp. PCC 7428]AFZ33627.1 hypothetical protein Glo7428_5252 [Gloeocapsa sp. PCC 7428]
MPTTDITLKFLQEDIALLIEIASMLTIPLSIWLSIWGFSKLGDMNLELRLLTLGSGQGKVRLDEFAIRCSVHVAVARWYLNSKARQLNGVREVDELGDVVYLFGDAKRKFLQEHLASITSERGDTP